MQRQPSAEKKYGRETTTTNSGSFYLQAATTAIPQRCSISFRTLRQTCFVSTKKKFSLYSVSSPSTTAFLMQNQRNYFYTTNKIISRKGIRSVQRDDLIPKPSTKTILESNIHREVFNCFSLLSQSVYMVN